MKFPTNGIKGVDFVSHSRSILGDIMFTHSDVLQLSLARVRLAYFGVLVLLLLQAHNCDNVGNKDLPNYLGKNKIRNR